MKHFHENWREYLDEEQEPEVVEEEVIEEKDDACTRKVKSRYKVWPSAYASGALVKCRKVGAANWGNKSKVKKACGGEVTFVNARGFNNMLPGKRKQTKLG